jgi:hypothetical protein
MTQTVFKKHIPISKGFLCSIKRKVAPDYAFDADDDGAPENREELLNQS